MDTTDPSIVFDEKGVCNHCLIYEKEWAHQWLRGFEGEQAFRQSIQEIKDYGKRYEYDCIIGLSGGIDSSYLAYLGHQQGLRMLAVHVDAGWNSELAVQNIQNICSKLNIDLVTEVVDWDEMRDLQRAFFKSGVMNQDIPQDMAFFAALYKYAVKNNIQYVLTGFNIVTESTLPEAWQGYKAIDKVHIKAIHKKHGARRLKKFPLIDFWISNYYYSYFKKLKRVNLLNFIDYNPEEAMNVLSQEVGYTYYGSKHQESRFTRFHQSYFLPKKFGVDKRRAHLASMVMSGLISRSEALEKLKEPLYRSVQLMEEDRDYVAKKLGFTIEEFDKMLKSPPGKHSDYPASQITHKKLYGVIKRMKFLKRLFG